jgi:hypothetical protein
MNLTRHGMACTVQRYEKILKTRHLAVTKSAFHHKNETKLQTNAKQTARRRNVWN